MLDEELMGLLEPTLPPDVPHVFISAVTGTGTSQLKDLLWTALNSESNRLEDSRREAIVHRPKDLARLHDELEAMGEEEDFAYEYEEEDPEDFEYEYEEEDWEEDETAPQP